VDIETQVGKGTTFRISLPLTLAIIPSLLVSVQKEKFAIPQMNISELIHISAAQAKNRLEVVGDAEVLVLRERLIPLLRLADVLGMQRVFTSPFSLDPQPDRRQRISDRRSKRSNLFASATISEEDSSQLADENRLANSDRRYHATSDIDIVVIDSGVIEYGLVVDELHDTLEIVVRPLGQHLISCSQYTGASVLGDGRVALILDAAGLAEQIRPSSLAGSTRATELQKLKNQAVEAQKGLVSLLLFHNAPEECCAVPLEIVERIEHIHRSQVENAGNRRTMQYRGQSLPLLMLKDTAQVGEFSEAADLAVIVISYNGHPLGLLAAQPIDAIEVVMEIDSTTHRQKGISGSGIIGRDTTLLVDVNEIADSVLGVFHSDLVPAARMSPAESQEQTESKTGKSEPVATILLAEDSNFFRNQVGKYLQAAGYRVLVAEDGQAGLDLLYQNAAEVRLVVTDIEMPIMDGLELTRRIKGDLTLAHLPVIALTTLADEDDIAAGKEAGVTAYEVKLDKEKLLASIRQYLLL
jgi:two-component system, chemotaxis family, sensor kinase CheA